LRLTRKVRILLFILSFIPGVKMDIVDLSTVSPDDANRARFLDELCARLELQYASYASQNPFSGQVQGYANYPAEWKKYYTANGLHLIDPTLGKAALSIAPVDWTRLSGDEGFDRIFLNARDFGILPQGISVPIRGPYGDCGILNVTRACSDREWQLLKRKIIGELQIAAVHIHDSVMSEVALNGFQRFHGLSSREREIMQWIAAGKQQQDVGDILSISARTIEVHLRSAREKLGALTTSQAVGRAIRLGLIHAA
jgi:DNA-binding CsgD family transcriptional regulator